MEGEEGEVNRGGEELGQGKEGLGRGDERLKGGEGRRGKESGRGHTHILPGLTPLPDSCRGP